MKKYPLIICSHHKSGASFTVKTFRSIANELHRNLWMKFYDPDLVSSDWEICIHQHGRVDDLLYDRNFKGWHCVRHPKALIYSAMLYHQKCKEPWVDVPLSRFSGHTFWSASDGRIYNRIKDPNEPMEQKRILMNSSYEGKTTHRFLHYESSYELKGKTYREFLTGLNTTADKLLFEMRAYSRGVIYDMLNFPIDRRFFLIKLEDISKDPYMDSLAKSFIHLDFEGNDLIKCIEIASNNCLWKIGKKGIIGHATTGMSDEWKEAFSGEVEKEYRRLFGWAEEALGYE